MLENTRYRLENNLGLTVVYFGGSITEGSGASTYDNCWAAKTTAYLKNRYPDCEIVVYEGGQDVYDYYLAVE